MQTKLETITNGIDVARLEETVAAVKASPKAGSLQFRLQNQWVDGAENRSEIQTFIAGGKVIGHKKSFVLASDEPEMLLGNGEAPGPVEYLLHALAACVTTAMIYHAAARGIVVERVESTLEGDIDLQGFLGLSPDVRKGYQNIRMSMRIKANISDEQFRELSALGPNFSPVYDSITRGVPVEVTAERM